MQVPIAFNSTMGWSFYSSYIFVVEGSQLLIQQWGGAFRKNFRPNQMIVHLPLSSPQKFV